MYQLISGKLEIILNKYPTLTIKYGIYSHASILSINMADSFNLCIIMKYQDHTYLLHFTPICAELCLEGLPTLMVKPEEQINILLNFLYYQNYINN